MQEAEPLLVFPSCLSGRQGDGHGCVVITGTALIGFNVAFVSNTVLKSTVISERLPLQGQPQYLLKLKQRL